MNRALWKKAVADAWLHLAISCALLLLFSWVFVWLMSQLKFGALPSLIRWLPDWVKSMFPVPPELLASPVGQISVIYVHVVTQIVCVAWALGRGSDTISGEIGRGTMDLLASLPIHRPSMLLPPAVVAAAGGMLLSASVLAGTAVGVWLITFPEPVPISAFLPGALNLFCLTFLLTGLTVAVSACSRDRWRTMAIAGGLFILEVILELVRRVWHVDTWPAEWQPKVWMKSLTFMSAYQPQELILIEKVRAELTWVYNGALLGLGLAAYAFAAVVFTYRDIPNPR